MSCCGTWRRSFERFQGHSEAGAQRGLQPGREFASDRETEDGQILVWNLEDPDVPPEPCAPTPTEVTSLAFDGEGRQLASGSWDGKSSDLAGRHAELRHVETGARVNDVFFDPMGTCLRWQPEDLSFGTWLPRPERPGRQSCRPEGPHRRRHGCCIRPDGRWLATGSDDHTVRLWLQLEELVELGCASAGRNLEPGGSAGKSCPARRTSAHVKSGPKVLRRGRQDGGEIR